MELGTPRRPALLLLALGSILVVLGSVQVVAASSSSQGSKNGGRALNQSLADSASAEISPVIVYYFHRTIRCHTCLTIEAYVQEALEGYFGSEIEEGRLVWRPTNLEESGNEHFEEDFKLQQNSVILTESAPVDSTSWRNLEDVWDLLGSKDAFLEYIRANVASALGEGTEF